MGSALLLYSTVMQYCAVPHCSTVMQYCRVPSCRALTRGPARTLSGVRRLFDPPRLEEDIGKLGR